ncbi:GDP-mannose 4,6-dehydratase [Chloroflexota bacterium]
MNKVAVIGSNSFSGAHFVDFLLGSSDCEVTGISRSPEYNAIFLPYKKRDVSRFSFYQMDINKNLDEIMALLDREEPDVIVNFAAQGEVGSSWKNPAQWFQTNCIGISNLAYKLKDREYLNRYVHISTPEVYGTSEGRVVESTSYNPSTPYAASKAAGDLFLFVLVKNFSFPLIMVRSTNVYGPHQQLYRIIPRSIIYMKMGKKIPLHGGGDAVKSFLHIRDVCEGIHKAIEKGRAGEIYHFSPKAGYSIRNVVEMIAGKMGLDFNEVTESVGERLGQDEKYVIDSTKAREELGWQPRIPFDEGLDEVIDWINHEWETIIHQPLEYVHQP